MSLYHHRRSEYIDSLPAGQSSPLLPCINETMRKKLHGVACSASALAARIQQKLQAGGCIMLTAYKFTLGLLYLHFMYVHMHCFTGGRACADGRAPLAGASARCR